MRQAIKFHPLASLFPLMEGAEFAGLVADIREHGQREPIWLHPKDGRIIDGRNRYKACLEVGIKPRYQTWNGKGSLIHFIVSLNLKRRHLTPSQRAVLALELLPALEAEARTRQATSTGGKKPQLMEKIPQAEKGAARAKAAELVGVNERYISQAKKVQAEAPELLKQVGKGEITLVEAQRQNARTQNAKKAKELSEANNAQWPNPIAAGREGWTVWGFEAKRTKNSHCLPLEAMWQSPRDRLQNSASRLPGDLQRYFGKFREHTTCYRHNLEQLPDAAVAAINEMERVFDECREILLEAAETLADKFLAAADDASNIKIPWGAKTPEFAKQLLEANQSQKNGEGWCAELGCWALIEQQSGKKCGEVYCPEHEARRPRELEPALFDRAKQTA
jgi:ParB-like chromosome segregation protein Spo0J